MKQIALLFALLIVSIGFSNATEPVKQDSTQQKSEFMKQYDANKSEYMLELKKDSFLVSEPILSQNLYVGMIEVAPGIQKRHFTTTVIGVRSEWRYPEFNNKQFEAWLNNKEKKTLPQKKPDKK